MATRGVHLLCLSAVRISTKLHVHHVVSVVAVPTVRDTSGEVDFDFVGRGPGPHTNVTL